MKKWYLYIHTFVNTSSQPVLCWQDSETRYTWYETWKAYGWNPEIRKPIKNSYNHLYIPLNDNPLIVAILGVSLE